jgi:circadian clock protein KaiB
MTIRKQSEQIVSELDSAVSQSRTELYVLCLYVSGISPKSVRAIINVKKFCREYLSGRHSLEVIDVYKQPALAVGEQIIAVPTLIKRLPAPFRRLIGDMSNIREFLLGMDLEYEEHRES